MIYHTSTILGAMIVAGILMSGMPCACAQTPAVPGVAQSALDTVDAPVLKVFSAEQDGHRFVAYQVRWNGSDVIVSDPLARSDFKEGDTIRFLAQKVSLPNPSKQGNLSFTLFRDLGSIEPADAALSPAEQKILMQIVGGDLEAARNPTERFYALNRAAKKALQAGKTHDAERLANELLETATTRTDDWNYGNAIQDGNQVLGRIALSRGDVAEAKKRLIASADSKGSPQMNSFGPNMQLAKDLLAKGEKEVVLEYFDRCKSFWELGQAQLATWSEAVRNGQTPEFGGNLKY